MPESRQASPESAQAPEAEGKPSPSKGEPDPLIGRVIHGRFKVVSVIARGGMGKVYRAEQAPLGRICALKVLSPKYDGDKDPEFHKRFLLEASTAAKLTHPNTVTIFDYGQDGDLYFIAMEYIEGRTLHRVLREEGPFPEARVIFIAAQICRSLREAHSVGVVHRDLKPGNILLSDRGDERDNVKVLDFGLVKDVTGQQEDLTQAGLFMGSPKYMAPEQILGGEITARTDIYSLGVMMYEMLTGKVPFDRGASVGTLMAHVNDKPPPMHSVNPHLTLSPAMEALVERCLEKDPQKRYVSMKDLLHALKRVGNEDASLLETHESMPIARIGLSSPPSNGPDTFSGSQPSISSSSISTSAPHSTDVRSQVQSNTNVLFSSMQPVDEDAGQGRSKRGWVWAIAALAAAGIGAFVFMSSQQGNGGNQGETPSTASTGEAASSVAATANAPASATASAAGAGPSIQLVRVESEPSGANVMENGVERCHTTPCEVVWKDDDTKKEHTLVLNKRGYRPSKLTVTPSDTKANAKLEIIPISNFRPKNTGSSTGSGDKGPYKPSPY